MKNLCAEMILIIFVWLPPSSRKTETMGSDQPPAIARVQPVADLAGKRLVGSPAARQRTARRTHLGK